MSIHIILPSNYTINKNEYTPIESIIDSLLSSLLFLLTHIIMTIIDPPVKEDIELYRALNTQSKNSCELTLFDDASDLVVTVSEEEDVHYSQEKHIPIDYSIKVCVFDRR